MDNIELISIKSEPSSNESLCDNDEYSDYYQDTPEFVTLNAKLELNSPPITENDEVLDLSCKWKQEYYKDNKQTNNNQESPAWQSELNIKSENTEENKNTDRVNKKDSHTFYMTNEAVSQLIFLNQKYYKCKHCDFETTKMFEYTLHLFFHTPGNEPKNPLTCLNHRFSTMCENHLATHKIRHRTPYERDTYTCKLCEHEALYQTSLKHHQLSHKSARKSGWYECAKCPYQSGYINNLRKHVLHEHREPEDLGLLQRNHCEYEAIQGNQTESNIKKNYEENNSV